MPSTRTARTLPRLLRVSLVLMGSGGSAAAQCEVPVAELTPLSSASAIGFGTSVDLSGSRMIVGSPDDDEGMFGIDGGSVQIHFGGKVSRIAIATPSYHFGASVAIDGTDAIAGAPGDDQGQANSGAAYLLHEVGTFSKSWVLGNKLKASTPVAGAGFGSLVDMANGIAVVASTGPPNTVHVFRDDGGGVWSEEDVLGFPGSVVAVATNGVTTLVADTNAIVFVYHRLGTGWSLSNTLISSSGTGSTFGASVALDMDLAAVAEPDILNPGAGKVHTFVATYGQPALPAVVLTLDASAGLALDAYSLVAGSTSSGSAKVLAWDGASYVEEAEVSVPGVECVAYDADRIVAGAPSLDKAYAFDDERPCEVYCTPGTSASGCQAGISASGTASASAPAGFLLSVSTVEGAKDGLLFFGANGRQANPWGNGTSYQCVVPPVTRAGLLTGTGTSGQCDGALSQDLNALWCPGCPKPQKNPGAGALVQAQLWYRDPQNTSNQTTSLSDAIEFAVGL